MAPWRWDQVRHKQTTKVGVEVHHVRDDECLDQGDCANSEDKWCNSIYAWRVNFARHLNWVQDEIENKND